MQFYTQYTLIFWGTTSTHWSHWKKSCDWLCGTLTAHCSHIKQRSLATWFTAFFYFFCNLYEIVQFYTQYILTLLGNNINSLKSLKKTISTWLTLLPNPLLQRYTGIEGQWTAIKFSVEGLLKCFHLLPQTVDDLCIDNEGSAFGLTPTNWCLTVIENSRHHMRS